VLPSQHFLHPDWQGRRESEHVAPCTQGTYRERLAAMAFGGGGPDDSFLIGPFMEWWDKRTAKRDAKRSAKLEAKTAKREGKAKPKA